jgi:hypothetical protein
MFPDARFVHIHRDPYAVFQSFVHVYAKALPFGRLQDTSGVDWTGRLIRQYQEIHDAFFEERALIPAGRFHEMSYEELERDPMDEMRKLYVSLALPEFEIVEPALRTYLDSQAGYQKNVFPELAPDVRQHVAAAWGRCFDEWGYPR